MGSYWVVTFERSSVRAEKACDLHTEEGVQESGSLSVVLAEVSGFVGEEAAVAAVNRASILLREHRRNRGPAIIFTTPKRKRLADLVAADIPRGLTPEDVASDY